MFCLRHKRVRPTRFDRLRMADILRETLKLLQGDGEAGQLPLRHSSDQLHVVLDASHHLRIFLIDPCDASDLDLKAAESYESVLADSLDELESLVNSAGVEVELDAFIVFPELQSNKAGNVSDILPIEQTIFKDQLGKFAKSKSEFQSLSKDSYGRLSALLFPKREWRKVQLVEDHGRLARHETRRELDHIQRKVCWGLNIGTTVIEGGAGTGKSLVLASRAIWLMKALQNPRILLLTWNKSLASAISLWLQRLARESPPSKGSVKSMPFCDVLQENGIQLSLSDPTDADHRSREMLKSQMIKPMYDAILVDEAQDFGGELLKLVEHLVCDQRGGLTLALDSQQNIRFRPHIDFSSLPQPITRIQLDQSYRSTSAIRGFSEQFGCRRPRVSSEEVNGDVEPVRLVWAESQEDCLRMIVSETLRLIQDVGLQPHEIMVVCYSTPSQVRLRDLFAAHRIAVNRAGLEDAGKGIRVASPEVAKGHEANCVFVVGWDEVSGELMTKEQACRRYVASSRAADILYVLYSAQNVPEELLQGPRVAKQLWPDDFQTNTE